MTFVSVSASDTTAKQIDSGTDLPELTFKKNIYSEVDYYYYDMKPPEQEITMSEEIYREHDDLLLSSKPRKQYSSDTEFVNYYFEPLTPTYRFLDKERQHRWNNVSFDYTLSQLDSSLYYKTEMFGLNFKAKAQSDVFDESSVLFNWNKNF